MKRKGEEVLAPDRANQEAWEDHRRFGEERGKATMSTLVAFAQMALTRVLLELLYRCHDAIVTFNVRGRAIV